MSWFALIEFVTLVIVFRLWRSAESLATTARSNETDISGRWSEARRRMVQAETELAKAKGRLAEIAEKAREE